MYPVISQLQGNPLFCGEFAMGLLNRNALGKDWNLFQFEAPDSLEGLVSSRMDLLPHSAQNLLKLGK
jgi:hypothetical protein